MYPKLLLFSSLVYIPLALGAAAGHLRLLRMDPSRPIMKFCWLSIEPLVIIIAFWGLDLRKVADLASAPVLGAAWMLAMIMPGHIAAAALKLKHPQRGNFLLASMFSNNGITLGAFLCLVFIGDEGLAMSILFMVGFSPLLLTVGFGIGKHSARKAALANGDAGDEPLSLGILRLVPYSALALGLALNIGGARLPDFTPYLTRCLVFADVVLYSFAIGTLFVLGSVRRFFRECLVMSGLKFIVSPIIGLLLFFIAAQFADLSPLLLRVMVIQCAMPVAIMSVVVSRFCRLDMQLAAACWVFTTLAVAGLVPALAYAVSYLG